VEPLGTIKLTWYAENVPPPQVPQTTEFLVGDKIAVRLAIGSKFILDKELLVYNFKSLGEGVNVLLCNKKSKGEIRIWSACDDDHCLTVSSTKDGAEEEG
jgi:hypothetical protein